MQARTPTSMILLLGLMMSGVAAGEEPRAATAPAVRLGDWELAGEDAYIPFVFTHGAGGFIGVGSAGRVVRWQPDGAALELQGGGVPVVSAALGPGRVYRVRKDGRVDAVSLKSGAVEACSAPLPLPMAAALVGDSLAVGTRDGVWLLDAQTLALVRRLPIRVPVISLAAHKRQLAFGDTTGRVWFGCPDTGRWAARQVDPFVIYALAWSPDGLVLAAGGAGLLVTLIDVPRARLDLSLEATPFFVTALAWTPDGTRLIVGDESCHLTVIDLARRAAISFTHHTECWLTSLAVGGDGTLLAGCGPNSWGQPAAPIGRLYAISCSGYSPAGELLSAQQELARGRLLALDDALWASWSSETVVECAAAGIVAATLELGLRVQPGHLSDAGLVELGDHIWAPGQYLEPGRIVAGMIQTLATTTDPEERRWRSEELGWQLADPEWLGDEVWLDERGHAMVWNTDLGSFFELVGPERYEALMIRIEAEEQEALSESALPCEDAAELKRPMRRWQLAE